MDLAFDFFNGKEVRNQDDYESSLPDMLPHGQRLSHRCCYFAGDEEGGYPFGFFFDHRSDWIEGVASLQTEVFRDPTISLFLTDAMMNYEIEIALADEPHQWYSLTVSKQNGQVRSVQKELKERVVAAKAAEEKELRAQQSSSVDNSFTGSPSGLVQQRVAIKGHRMKKRGHPKKKPNPAAVPKGVESGRDSDHDGQNKPLAHKKSFAASSETSVPDDDGDGWSTISTKKTRKSSGQVAKVVSTIVSQRVTQYPHSTSSKPTPKTPHQVQNQRSSKSTLKVTPTIVQPIPVKLEDFPPLPHSTKPSGTWVKEAVSPSTIPEKREDFPPLPSTTKVSTPPAKKDNPPDNQIPEKLEDSSPLPKSPPSPAVVLRDNQIPEKPERSPVLLSSSPRSSAVSLPDHRGLEKPEDSPVLLESPPSSAVVPLDNQNPEQPQNSPPLAASPQSPINTAKEASRPSTPYRASSSKTSSSDHNHGRAHAESAIIEPKLQIHHQSPRESAHVPKPVYNIPVIAKSSNGDSEPDGLDADVELSSNSTSSSSAASSVIHVEDSKPTRFVRHDFANIAAEANEIFDGDPKFTSTARQDALPEPQFPYSYICTSCRLRKIPTMAIPITLCPGCGPLCNIKYCSTECLLANALYHSGQCMRWSPSEDVVRPITPRLDDPFRFYPESFIPYYAGNHKVPESPELFRQKAFSQWRFPDDYFVFNPDPAGRDVLYT